MTTALPPSSLSRDHVEILMDTINGHIRSATPGNKIIKIEFPASKLACLKLAMLDYVDAGWATKITNKNENTVEIVLAQCSSAR